MVTTYVRIQHSSEGPSPVKTMEIMRSIGYSLVIGEYDFKKEIKEEETLYDVIEELHTILKGQNVRYSITTRVGPKGGGEGLSELKPKEAKSDED
jgi:hypothetical protein